MFFQIGVICILIWCIFFGNSPFKAIQLIWVNIIIHSLGKNVNIQFLKNQSYSLIPWKIN
jgi:hypothetical protein